MDEKIHLLCQEMRKLTKLCNCQQQQTVLYPQSSSHICLKSNVLYICLGLSFNLLPSSGKCLSEHAQTSDFGYAGISSTYIELVMSEGPVEEEGYTDPGILLGTTTYITEA